MDLNKIKVYRGNPLMMGATVIGDTVNFAITARLGSKCELVLYEKGKNNEAARIPFENAQVIGNVFAMSIEGLDYKKYDYNFSIDGKIVTDAYAKALSGKEKWGIVPTDIRGSIVSSEFDWQNDAPLRRPYDETIIYRLHVRGFTKHVSSKAKHKGTYLGIVDKIPYLKELGITMIELMPAYEFNEMESHVATSMKGQFSIENPVLNYWGYTSGYAFAPKASYAYATKPGSEVEEFKYMVRELHRNGIDFYANVENKNLANFNDDFMVSARKFIKGDEDMLNTISYKIKANPPAVAVVNYVANHNTFTLYDAVSYDKKYNQANGENNRDGAVYNYSWNCGAEGDTRKRKINELRKHQIKNALSLVLLSQGVPMIYAGDEMCNSQKGNNNPYCLDNEISWTNWNTTAMAKEILDFTKKLIQFRKQHKILHLSSEPRLMDYKSYGLPDMSYHGSKAWYADFSHFNRHFSVMYCGKYATIDGKEDEADLFIAYNMFWEMIKFGIPSARNKRQWKVVFATDSGFKEPSDGIERMLQVPPRSIVVLMAK